LDFLTCALKAQIKCAFGLALDKIDSDRIDSDRIDFDKIDFERIDLCLDTIKQNWLNKLNVVWMVLIKIAFECIIT